MGDFPYQASLRTASNGHFCGGFIHTNRWVVSAAHCTFLRTIATTRVVVGTVLRSAGGILHTTDLIRNHPSYNSLTLANDISLVRTASPMVFNDNVKAIPLGRTHIGSGVPAVATGWGQTSNPGSAPNNLQFLNLQTITNAECRNRHNILDKFLINGNNICTTSPAGQGTCMGDSGGPLVANGVAIGVVSWGIACATSTPDVYVRVYSFASWIDDIISANP